MQTNKSYDIDIVDIMDLYLSPLIFLDIDGVLNIFSKSYSTLAVSNDNRFKDSICRMEYILVKRLEYILMETDANIVIISSWDIPSIKEALAENDFNPDYMYRIISKIGKAEENRIEISREFAETFNNKNYVILDDEIRDYDLEALPVEERYKFIHINMEDGLTSSNVRDIIAILNHNRQED